MTNKDGGETVIEQIIAKKPDTFNIELDGKETALRIKQLSVRDGQEARRLFHKTFKQALDDGALLECQLEEFMKKQNIWTDKHQKRLEKLTTILADKRNKLSKGGIKLAAAATLTDEIIVLDQEYKELLSVKIDLVEHTAESQATDVRFNYLVYKCLVYDNTSKRVFDTFDQYMDCEDFLLIEAAGNILMKRLYPLTGLDISELLPEKQFLQKHSQKPDISNDVQVEAFQPFLDDDGKPINVESV